MDKKNLLVSIIVPVYNVEIYLEKCIKSLIEQTYKNIEIILVDDGSLDKSGKICDQYQSIDFRIEVYHKSNGGLSDARNYGLDHAKGEYIFFVDSDDCIEVDSIEKLLDYAVINDADIVCCGINDYVGTKIVSKRGALECKTISGKEASDLLLENGDEIGIVAWNKLYKAKLFENIRFVKGKINEDVFFTPKVIYMAKKVGITNYYIYNYVQNRGDSICNRPLSIKNMDSIEAFYDNSLFFKGKDNRFVRAYEVRAASMMMTLYCYAKTQENMELCSAVLEKYKDKIVLTLKACLKISVKEFMKNLIFLFSKNMYYRLWFRKKK